MNIRIGIEDSDFSPGPVFVLITDSEERVMKIKATLKNLARIHVFPMRDYGNTQKRILEIKPRIAVIDFYASACKDAISVSTKLRRSQPDLPLVALGKSDSSEVALAALRSNVNEFVDIDADAQEVLALLRPLFGHGAMGRGSGGGGKTIAVIGAREGVGVSTFASNLAWCLQSLRRRRIQVLLMDWGLPAADSAIFLGVKKSFDLVDLSRVLDRIDSLFLDSALSKTDNGLAVLPLAGDKTESYGISPSAAVELLEQMKFFFGIQVIDLSGYRDMDFVAKIATQCTQTLLLTDQAATSIVSACSMSEILRSFGAKPHLIINQFDQALAPSAEATAARLDLPLMGTLPARRTALINAMNQGKPLYRLHAKDAYSKAVRRLVSVLAPSEISSRHGMLPAPIRSLLEKLLWERKRVRHRVAATLF